MVSPSRCPRCESRFLRDFVLQVELRHMAATVGAGAAEAELNERYGEQHAMDEHDLKNRTSS